MTAEKYKLSWTPSPSSNAAKQFLCMTIGVEKLGDVPLAKDAVSLEVDFETDATVEWFIKTTDLTGLQSVESNHVTFIATNQTPIAPATNLAQEFVVTVPA